MENVEGVKSIKGVEGLKSKFDINAIFDTIIKYTTIGFSNAIFDTTIAGLRLYFFNTVCNICLICLLSFFLRRFSDFLVNALGLMPSLPG